MSEIKQDAVPKNVLPDFTRAGLKVKNYRSVKSFEKDLIKFIKKNEVLHLCTSKQGSTRSTPVGYKNRGLIFYALSEGGGKFANLTQNRRVSFSIAEPDRAAEGFWGYKGLQAWGKASVCNRKENPEEFEKAFKAMDIVVGGRKLKV